MLNEYELIPSKEWDFRNVPNEQLIACCLWEYARESKSLALSAQRHRVIMRSVTGDKNWGGLPAEEVAFAKYLKKIENEERESGFDYESFLDRFWHCEMGYVRYYDSLRQHAGVGAVSWDDLSEKVRKCFSKEVKDRTIFEPFMPAYLKDLELLWNSNSRELLNLRAQKRAPNDDREGEMLFSPTKALFLSEEDFGPKSRLAVVAFTIDFSRFSNREIVDALGMWVKANRPKHWSRPGNIFPGEKRGRKLNDYRVALERLAIMRLLHFYSPKSLQIHLPTAWKLYGQKEPNFRREIQAACKFFRQLFPFLPKNERPVSRERCLSWMRPIMKIMDEGINSDQIF